MGWRRGPLARPNDVPLGFEGWLQESVRQTDTAPFITFMLQMIPGTVTHTTPESPMRTSPFRLALLVATVLAVLSPARAQAQGPSQTEAQLADPTLIVLVRHAERAGPSAEDPGLTPIGSERARALARLLEDAGITQIHASPTRRARDTGLPLAEHQGLEIERYDPRDLEGFAARLLALPGRHLVVGHSNTTDELSVLLGGASYGPIMEEWEYDRLYLLTPQPGGGMGTVLIRLGPPVERDEP